MKEQDNKIINTEHIEEINTADTIICGVSSIYEELLAKYGGNHLHALFEYCFLNNIPYLSGVAKEILSKHEDSIDCLMPEPYETIIKTDSKYHGLTFFKQIKMENFEKIYQDEATLLGLDEETLKNRLQCIDILSYDPFKDEDLEDRPQLYRDMCGMLTDNMRKDIAKAKAALSVVRGYNNLEKYQKKINEIMKTGNTDDETQKTLDQLIKIQKTLQDSINTTAEKNNFTTKGIGNAGKGMLSDVMNQIQERGIDEGVTNFYDIATSKSIEEIANISFKAQLNQVNLSKTDYADIINTQTSIVRDAQRSAQKATEALRIAKEKIVKQELIDELANDYRKKGISEKEIEEFVAREYTMYSFDN